MPQTCPGVSVFLEGERNRAVPVQHQFPPEAARHSLPLPPLISPSLVSHRVIFCSISSPSLRIPPPSSLFSSSSSRLGYNMTAATKS